MTLPPWDPDEYDQQVKALRKLESAERRADLYMQQKGIRAASTIDPRGPARGLLTSEELERRTAVDRAMRRRRAT
jgi:hypothetical protein